MASEEKINLLLEDYNLLERYLENLFKFMPLPTALLSPLEVVLEFNPAFEKISGYSLEEIVGLNVKKLFKESRIKRILKEASRKGFIRGKEINLVNKRGKEIPVSIFISVRKVRAGRGGYFISLFDLREVKRRERKLLELKNTLEIRVKAREEELKELAKELERRIRERKREIEERIKQLDKIRKLIVERELKMIKLKKENRLLREKIERLEQIYYERENVSYSRF